MLALAVVAAGTTAISELGRYRSRTVRRTAELRATREALQAHYEAVDAIIDDPALPDAAAELIAFLSEVISDRNATRELVNRFLANLSRGPGEGGAAGSKDMETLRDTRPDLVANFHRALMSGLVVAFLKWPENAGRFSEFHAHLAADTKSESAVAARIVEMKSRFRSSFNDKLTVPA